LDEVKKHSESSLEISLEKNLPWTEGAALIFAGWSDHRKNKPGSFEQIVSGLDQINSYGSTSFDSAGHWWLAYLDAAIHAHQYDVAMEKLQYILKTVKSLGCEQVLPEVLRLKGLCYLGKDGSNHEPVESHFSESLTEARKHKNKIFELRTAISYAKFLGENGERQKAYDLLHPIYDGFTEGFETGLLQEAAASLKELQ